MEDTTPAGRPIIDREKTAPFLIQVFIKIAGVGGATAFKDEQQIYTWKDATLREVLTTLRSTAPPSPEYRHPLARYSFRAVYADSANRGREAQKELGTVYSRDILGEPGTLASPAPRLLTDTEPAPASSDDERTLDELRFVPGDHLHVTVQLPKNVTLAPAASGELSIKGSGSLATLPSSASGAAFSNGWKKESSGHWRGSSDAPASGTRGSRGGRGGGRGGPPRRDSPPRRGGGGWGDRGGRDRRSPSRSRSRSPPPRRRGSRYD
ncbi:hypothetical protein BDW22DRAFT_355451 [Trametopsis cervina]|nr:hypothetical protein BDW22DRAFT_355451 [Trametopsis cervina]